MKRIIVFFLFALLFVPAAFAAEKAAGVEEFTSVEELAVALSSYFPKVQGEVKAVQGDRLTLGLGKKEGLLAGMMLTLWREGREILHPATQTVIGRVEDEVGTIEVIDVEDRSSTAVLKKKQKDPKPGDRARITSRKINAAILPLREENMEIVKTVGDRLNEFGRYNVLDAAKVDAFVKNSKMKDTALVKGLGTTFGLDAVITLGIFPTEGKLMVTARIFYAEEANQLDTVVAMLDLKSKKDALGEIKPFFNPSKEEKTIVSHDLPFFALYFVTGDFDGDGKPEYAFSDGTRIHIYREEASGWREVWTETVSGSNGATTMEWREIAAVPQAGATIRHLNVDSADINENGMQEIFVTAMQSGKVFSYVVEFKDEAYQRIAEIPGFLRVVNHPEKGTILISQAYDPESFYSGQLKQYTWSQEAYGAGASLPMHKNLGIYGWTYARFGERQPLIVALDEDDHLLVYNGETLLWKSAEQYTVMDSYVYRPVTEANAIVSKNTGETDKSRRERLRGRVFALDLDADGKDEIIVTKNIAGTFIGGFLNAELHGLNWTGARLDPGWSIKDIPGPVFDFRVIRQDQQGPRINALVRTKGGLFTKDRQQVMSYSVRQAEKIQAR